MTASLLEEGVVRLLATAVLIVLVARVAERAGPFVASTILTLPLFAGPSYFFLMFEVSTEFLATSVLYAFAGTGPVLAFTAGVVNVIHRAGLLAGLAVGASVWLMLALPLHWLVLDLSLALAWCAAGVALVIVFRRPVDLHARPVAGRSAWRPLLLRSMVAGIAVALVSIMATFLGPEVTGIIVSFPLTLSVSAWLVYRQYGASFAAAMLTATQRTLPTYAVFCLGLHVLAPHIGVQLGFTLALTASAISAGLLAWLGLHIARTRHQQSA
jgi:hypothetical protein